MHPHHPHRPTRRRAWATLALVAVLALFAAACGDDDDGGGALTASDVWARTSPAMADAGAVYMTLESDDGATVVGAEVDESVAARVELHETTMADGAMDDTDEMEDDMADTAMEDTAMEDTAMEDEMADTEMTDTGEMEDDAMEEGHSDGGMMMQPIDTIEVPAGGSVSLEPGGIHMMLLELAEPLEAGTSFDLTLILDDGEEHQVSVDVRDA
jgi:copper(I)-binding protein